MLAAGNYRSVTRTAGWTRINVAVVLASLDIAVAAGFVTAAPSTHGLAIEVDGISGW